LQENAQNSAKIIKKSVLKAQNLNIGCTQAAYGLNSKFLILFKASYQEYIKE
jgi:hypothetical protein